MKKTVKSIAVPPMFLDEQVVARSSIYLYLLRNSYPVCRSAEYSPRKCSKNSSHIWDAVGANFKHRQSMHSTLSTLVRKGQIIRHGGDYIIPTIRKGLEATLEMYSLQVPTAQQIAEHDRILASVLRGSFPSEEPEHDDMVDSGSDLDVDALIEDVVSTTTPEPVESRTEAPESTTTTPSDIPPKNAQGQYTGPILDVSSWSDQDILDQFPMPGMFASVEDMCMSAMVFDRAIMSRGLEAK